MSIYPVAIDVDKVGEYPANTKSGGGVFYDDVLEYRVWCRPWLGAPDEFDGEIYYYPYATYEDALSFSDKTKGCEKPLVLVRQFEWINEPEPNVHIHEQGERITEWLVEWLEDGKRHSDSIREYLHGNNV